MLNLSLSKEPSEEISHSFEGEFYIKVTNIARRYKNNIALEKESCKHAFLRHYCHALVKWNFCRIPNYSLIATFVFFLFY